MKQPEGFVVDGKENMVCRLQKSIYGLKQVSRQWYLKFHDVVTSLGFEENTVDSCIYLKVSCGRYCINSRCSHRHSSVLFLHWTGF